MAIQNVNKVINRGDDMDIDEGRALDWTEDADSDPWPADLTGATIQFELLGQVYPGVVVTPTGVAQKVAVEFTNEQTELIPKGRYGYELRAVLAAPVGSVGRVVTLAEGECLVKG